MTGRFPRQFGKYVLLKPLAKGGMGEIYLAAGGEVGGFEKLCVIKKVITEKADRTKANRFLDEAKVVLRLSHSALVNTFDAGEVNGEFYIAMELVEGKDLREVWNRCVRTRQRIPLDVALHVVREVARALAYVHGYGDLRLVHRDVAPPNILLAYVGDVKLTDFGLARSVLKQEHTAPGVVFGRAAYLSPEQARGEMADARTDVYTLGIVLWELLTGQQFLQLSGLDPAAALALVRHPKLVAPSVRAPWITPVLDQVALKALAPERDKRFQSAEELRQALTTVIAEIAPTADSSRVSDFLHSIYTDTISEERGERERFLKSEIPNFRSALARGVRFDEPKPEQAPGKERAREIRVARDADDDAGGISADAPTGPADERMPERSGRPRRATPRLPGMPDPDTPARETPAAPAFLSAFRADSARPISNGLHRATAAAAAVATMERPAGDLADAPVLGGRYRTGRQLLEGAVESLYAGHDPEQGPRVLHVYKAGPPTGALEAWSKAVRSAGKLRHPHLGEVADVVIDEGRAVAVHAAMSGVDITTMLSREQRLEPGAALRIAHELAQALTVAHAAGVVHGALRPSCVFLDGPGHAVKLLGFGLGRLYAVEDPANRQGGTSRLPSGVVEYVAPEVLRGAASDARVDVYGTGALLYELVTGVPPYAGSREALERKKQSPPQSPRLFRPDLSPEIESLLLRLLDPDPAKRPPSIAELSSELAALAEQAGPGDIDVPTPRDEERRRQRREAAFRAIAELSSESTAGPQLLESMLAGQAGGGAARLERRPTRPPPLPPGAGANLAAAVAAMPGGLVAPPPMPMGRALSAPAILTSALAPLPPTPGAAPPPAPMLGGGMLSRYGVHPADAGKRRVRTMVLVALVAIAGVAAVMAVRSSGSGPAHKPAPATSQSK